MDLLLRLRKADEMGINVGLRLLVLSLSFVLLLLMTYYFLVINRSLEPRAQSQNLVYNSANSERQKADAALMSKIKSALAQTKRLHGYGIGVEIKDGVVTLVGDVPSEIDKELAADVAKEVGGLKEVANQLRIVPETLPQPGEKPNTDLVVNVDDLELQANLRERLLSLPELKAQTIEVKVQNRQVTLTGQVASEMQKLRAEQVLRNYPKVTAVNNLLRISGNTALPKATLSPSPSPTIISANDQELTQLILAALRANRSDFSEVDAIKVVCQNGKVMLSGSVPARAERALAERLAREAAGTGEVRNSIVVGGK